MLERISNNEFAFIGGCIVWIPIAIWTIWVVGWMVQGDIGVFVGIPAFVFGIALGILTLNPPDPRLSPVFFTCALSIVVLFPGVQRALNRRALRRIDVELVEDQYAMLRERPGNVGAELRIARAAFDLGLGHYAVGVLERHTQNAPKAIYEEERRMLRKWKANLKPGEQGQRIVCVECGLPIEPGPVVCPRCGAPFLLDALKGRLFGGGVAGKLIAVWLAAVIGIAGLPSAALLLPARWALVVMVFLAAVIGVVLIIAFRRGGA